MPPDRTPHPRLVDSALTALHSGMNPWDAAVFALNHHYGLSLPAPSLKHPPQPPSEGPPAPTPGTLGKDKEPPAPKPKPAPLKTCKTPPPGVSCPKHWYWDTQLCRCEPLANPGAQ